MDWQYDVWRVYEGGGCVLLILALRGREGDMFCVTEPLKPRPLVIINTNFKGT
jgi:hypothetical protein